MIFVLIWFYSLVLVSNVENYLFFVISLGFFFLYLKKYFQIFDGYFKKLILGSIILLNKNFFFFLCFYGSFVKKKKDKFMYGIVLNIFV